MKKQFCIFLVVLLFATLTTTVSAADQPMQLRDFAYLLTDDQNTALNQEAVRVSEQYDCGIYIVTVDEWQSYGGVDVLDCARVLYDSYFMGYGSDKDGLLLLLSMDERDYALFTLGSTAELLFNDSALQYLEDQFLDNLANDDWAGGFEDYIFACESVLRGDLLADSSPDFVPYPDDAYTENPVWEEESAFTLSSLVGIVVPPCIIALVVCLILKAQLKSVRKPSADAYISPDGLNLQVQEDRFLYNTVTRRRIESSSSSGRSGGSRSSSGGSRSSGGGRSGKF